MAIVQPQHPMAAIGVLLLVAIAVRAQNDEPANCDPQLGAIDLEKVP